MCQLCDQPDLTPEKYDERIRALVDQHRFAVQAVGGSCCRAESSYTVWRRGCQQAVRPGVAQFLQSPVDAPRTQVLRRAAGEVARGGVLLVVGHACAPPWSTHQPDPALMPPAAQVLSDLRV